MNNALAVTPSSPMPKAAKGDGDNRGELSGIRIEFAENGMEICSSFEPKKVNPKFDRYSQMPENEEMVFKNSEIEQALDYLRQKLSGKTAPEANEPGEAAEYSDVLK